MGSSTRSIVLSPDHPLLPEAVRHVQPLAKPLWCAGTTRVFDGAVRVGIIGARDPRADSAQYARRIASDLARLGCVVVSGLARGVDGIAHQSALDAGGLTIAVLASGLRNVYPARHRSLAHRIAGDDETSVAAGGLLISEYGDGDEPAHPYRFRERNRIIAALSDYLVVIQARPTSGSMITAHRALELGVPIGIVPSGPADVCYEGSTALIRDGADAVLDGATVARRLAQHGIADVDTASLDEPTDPRITAFDVPRTSEEVAELLGISMSEARRMLRELEQLGAVCTTRDGRWARTISTAPRTNLVYNANSHEGE